ncbi:MAG: S8 family serine peptidase [Ardenticatenales bacterium]|nr:S8 family serine peptidase [Ardenticatenales bacterium]
MARKLSQLVFALLIVFSLLVPVAGQQRVYADGPSAIIDPQLTTALINASTPVSVIVTFRGNEAPGADEIALLKGLGITQGVTLRSLPMAGILATAAQINALATRPEVRSVYLNSPLTLYNGEANELTGVKRLRSDATITDRNNGMPVSGRGVAVVVNDSGIDCTHPDLTCAQNATGSTNLHALSELLPITYIEGIPNNDSNSGHGTHVAGTVAGSGAASGGKYEGVAPGATLIGYGSGGALFVLDGLGGLDYAVTHQHQYGIRVVTNSWGSSGGFDPEHPINLASKRAHDRGIVVTFAAGNAGPGEDTHNPYSKAPWVISVAAGTKQGTLADFSSRGTAGVGGTFTLDDQSWTWEDRPSVTAPGVDIISTRVLAPVSSLSAQQDAATLAPAHLPYYTHMSGTSMATPHVAGIIALMLEVNPLLSPAQVKSILQQTATNMPGQEPWEVGAGYVNAYAAVDTAFQSRTYGQTLNLGRTFNSNATLNTSRSTFSVEYNPALTASNRYNFTVPAGLTELVARVEGNGLLGETGNPINLVLIAPNGTEYSSGISLTFTLTRDRVVSVPAPAAGQWVAEVRGMRGNVANPLGVALPETVNGTLTFKSTGSFTGLNDIAGHAAEAAIKVAVSERLVDGYRDGTFKPNNNLTRRELAQSLVMGAGVRQFLPLNGSRSFPDVSDADLSFIEAVAARGAALKDRVQQANGLMRPMADGKFYPGGSVNRAALAYSLVQSLALQSEAVARNSNAVTVLHNGQRIAIEDASQIPAELRGYVQLALDLNIMNAYFTVTQGPFDLQPTVHATFAPASRVTRGEFAVTIARFYSAYLAQ